MTMRPLPVADEVSAPFWAACAKHVFTLPRCSQCQEFSLPPESTCPHCHSADPQFTFVPVSGRGKVRTWTVIRQSLLVGFKVPYLLVDVQFDDQPRVRMIAQLLDGPEKSLRIGAPVTVAFEDFARGVALPAFRLERPA
jgi:uncharacterized OB-fold protein